MRRIFPISHSKLTKRGSSHYIEGWNPAAKKFIRVCALCGSQGCGPTIDENGFVHPAPDVTDSVHSTIRAELRKTLNPLPLDEMGRCDAFRLRMEGQE